MLATQVKFLAPFLALVLSCSTYASESVSSFFERLDPQSRANLDDYLRENGVNAADFEDVSFTISRESGSDDELSNVVFEGKDPPANGKKQVLIFLGGGLGLVHNQGLHLLALEKNADGRFGWFVEGSLDFLTTRFGSYPDDVSLALGYFPFKKPTIGIAIAVHNPSYTEKTGVGPEVAVNRFLGKQDRFRLFTRIRLPVYIGEENLRGRGYTLFPDFQVGGSVKLLQLRSHSRSRSRD
jgi:hypothetical protein